MLIGVRLLNMVLGPFALTAPGLLSEIAIGVVLYGTLAAAWCLATRNPHFFRLFGKWLPERLR